MSAGIDRIPGVTVDVEDLLRIRAQLGGPSLRAIKRRASYRSGSRDTRARGRGMEYEESRAYVAGDDMRTMDWRVMARTGEAHTKIFSEEKERRLLLAVDLSASMFFGTRVGFKSWAAARVAARIGWLSSFTGGRIGGLVVAPGFHREVRPAKSRSGLMAMFHHLADASRLAVKPGEQSNRFNFLLRELNRVVRPGSIIALVSDFVGLDDESLVDLAAISMHNDINLFWVHDRTEVEAWPAGYYQVFANRRRQAFELVADNGWLLDIQRRHRHRIESAASRHGLSLVPVCCNRDIGPQVMQGLI